MPWTFWKKKTTAVCTPPAEIFLPSDGNSHRSSAEPRLPPQLARSPDSMRVAAVSGPCERCGACCAFFPVLFPEDETKSVLAAISLPAGALRRVMKGTEISPHRCVALQGEVGVKVCCIIYNDRPSTCRMFRRSWEDDTGNFLCDKARAVLGLQPFSQY